MFKGKRTYSEFADSEERISTNVLANRLKSLAAEGIIRREGSGRGTRYFLTRKGLDLLPVMADLIVWSGRYDPHTAADADFLRRAVEDRQALLAELEAELREAHGIADAV
jgi:DNA-binding HxlR family transcriptional regulator